MSVPKATAKWTPLAGLGKLLSAQDCTILLKEPRKRGWCRLIQNGAGPDRECPPTGGMERPECSTGLKGIAYEGAQSTVDWKVPLGSVGWT